jgi:hypothetical protein
MRQQTSQERVTEQFRRAADEAARLTDSQQSFAESENAGAPQLLEQN